MLMSIEEYGGEEEVKRQLAFVMQPYWAKWWDEFDLSDAGKDYPLEWSFAVKHVLGLQQLRWIAAQCARAALVLVRSPDRALCLDGIMNAERHAENPGRDTLLEMRASRHHSRGSALKAAHGSGEAHNIRRVPIAPSLFAGRGR